MRKRKPKKKKTNYVPWLIGLLFVIFILVAIYMNLPSDTQNGIETRLNREILDESFALGTQFLLNNQKPEGNFNYEYDWITKEFNEEDSSVRQAGALWGLTLIYNDNPNASLVPALEKGFTFFENYSRESDDGRKWIVYPGESYGKTGTVALFTLSLIDFLRSAEDIDVSFRNTLTADLEMYLSSLLSLRTDTGQFYGYYDHDSGEGYGSSSPYYDGESLLALTKAAKYMDKGEFKSRILESADRTIEVHIRQALTEDPDSAITKGFFQWGCMSFFELWDTGWEDTENYSSVVLYLADWMIDVHRTLDRTRNTAYAYEGIISAYEIARRQNDDEHIDKYAAVIDEGLYKLTSWQVGGPFPNEFLQNHTTTDPLAIGGVMNHAEEAPLRIDVTQHQMHAVILARRYVYIE